MGGFSDPIVGGVSKLIRKALQSPNYVPNVSGWSINKDGTAQFNELTLIGANGGVFIYSGPATNGNLIGSWSPTAGTDTYGNSYPAGLFTNQAQLTGIGVLNADIVQSVLTACSINSPSIDNASIVGGQILETQIIFDTTGGNLLIYSKSTASQTFTAAGETSWTAPVGSTGTAVVECWGAGGGGGNDGASAGGGGGGGGEYAKESTYSIVAGQVYNLNVGAGGFAGTGTAHGGIGGDTFFDVAHSGVYAHGGGAGGINATGFWVGGVGGTGSRNSTHFDGGAGGNGFGPNGGGGGGGSSAGTASVGNRGSDGSAGGGGAGGTAPTGGAAGGAGGANTVAGNVGNAPGGGGGGSGTNGGSSSRTDSWRPNSTHSYYGSDNTQGFPNTLSNTNGSLQQGNPDQPSLGKYYSFAHYDYANIQATLSGRVVDAMSIDITCQHSWYNSGMTIYLGYASVDSFPSPITPPGTAHVGSYGIGEGQSENISVPVSLAQAFQNGTAHDLYFSAPSDDLSYYGYFQGGTSGPQINIASHAGSAPVAAGAGANGQVKITYTASVALAASFSGTAFTDQYGNSIPVGVMANNVQIIQPGSNPAVPETWHTPTLNTGWATGSHSTGSFQNVRYRKITNNEVEVNGIIHTTSTTPNAVIWTMPSGYIPTTRQRINTTTNAGGNLAANGIDFMTDGSVQMEAALTTNLQDVQFNAIYPLD